MPLPVLSLIPFPIRRPPAAIASAGPRAWRRWPAALLTALLVQLALPAAAADPAVRERSVVEWLLRMHKQSLMDLDQILSLLPQQLSLGGKELHIEDFLLVAFSCLQFTMISFLESV